MSRRRVSGGRRRQPRRHDTYDRRSRSGRRESRGLAARTPWWVWVLVLVAVWAWSKGQGG